MNLIGVGNPFRVEAGPIGNAYRRELPAQSMIDSR
jgi:hypothetical protein